MADDDKHLADLAVRIPLWMARLVADTRDQIRRLATAKDLPDWARAVAEERLAGRIEGIGLCAYELLDQDDDADKALLLSVHMLTNQIEPQVAAAQMREMGVDVAAAFVYVGDDLQEGFTEVTCIGCGRTAQLPASAVKPGQVAKCPDCMTKGE